MLLSLDLDFFLSPIKYDKGMGRLDANVYTPWKPDAVRRFLEDRCGLRREAPVPGSFATHHHEAFAWWRELIGSGRLATPFDVVHIDAHADLGLGDASHENIMGDVLHRPVEERSVHTRDLDEGNFLAYALACRWLRSLTFVHPDEWRGRDLNFFHFFDYDDRSNLIELKKISPARLAKHLPKHDYCIRPYEAEPTVPFRAVKASAFTQQAPFDFIFFCQSPEYTPETADGLIGVVMEYVRLEVGS